MLTLRIKHCVNGLDDGSTGGSGPEEITYCTASVAVSLCAQTLLFDKIAHPLYWTTSQHCTIGGLTDLYFNLSLMSVAATRVSSGRVRAPSMHLQSHPLHPLRETGAGHAQTSGLNVDDNGASLSGTVPVLGNLD